MKTQDRSLERRRILALIFGGAFLFLIFGVIWILKKFKEGSL
jgi:hypothetical protein